MVRPARLNAGRRRDVHQVHLVHLVHQGTLVRLIA
jgi:hypothetical protein